MSKKVAIITGSTRGIGRVIALHLAKNGYNITVAGKTTKGTAKLPGDIYSVSDEIKTLGSDALPFMLDVRNDSLIKKCIKNTYEKWGRIDVLVNNAGALWWEKIIDTPTNRYDLINMVNTRASFLMSKEVIPYMEKNGGGHIIHCSPPLTINNTNTLAFSPGDLKGKTAYMISKLGMTITSMGIAQEYENTGIASNTLWPFRPIESYALINNNLGMRKHWRKASIIADCVLHILGENKNTFTGNQLIDEIYLKKKGVTDFSKYNCVKNSVLPKLNDLHPMWKVGKSKL